MIKQINLINAAVIFCLSLICWAIGTPQQTWNCLFAGLLVSINLSLLVWTLKRIFLKKSVALATTVIVIKYAALFGLFLFLYSVGWRIDFGFALGLSAMFPTLGFVAYQHIKNNDINELN